MCHKHILTSRRALITLLVSDVSRSHVKYSFHQPFKGRTDLSQIIEVILEVVTVIVFVFDHPPSSHKLADAAFLRTALYTIISK